LVSDTARAATSSIIPEAVFLVSSNFPEKWDTIWDKGLILDIIFLIAHDALHIFMVSGIKGSPFIVVNYERTSRQSQRVKSKFI